MVEFNFFSEIFLFFLWGKMVLILVMVIEMGVELEMVLVGVLLSLVVIYIVSKVGGEFFSWLNFLFVLGELVGGVVIGIFVLNLVIFLESGVNSFLLVIINILEVIVGFIFEVVRVIF